MPHGKIYDNITELIGNTPMVRLHKLPAEGSAEVIVKLEMFNPLSSVKDRISISMVEDAEKSGELKPGSTIVEATSGNTGIGLAFVAAAKGYKCTLVMPDTMSIERRKLLQALGAELILTPGPAGIPGAQKVADGVRAEDAGRVAVEAVRQSRESEDSSRDHGRRDLEGQRRQARCDRRRRRHRRHDHGNGPGAEEDGCRRSSPSPSCRSRRRC